jgi:hypothetical protein
VSAGDQLRLLKKLEKELAISSKAYREETADFKAHNFTLTRRALNRGITDTLKDSFPTIEEKDIKEIRTAMAVHVGGVIRVVGQKIEDSKDETIIPRVRTAHTVKAVFKEKEGKNRYSSIYTRYKKELQALAKTLSSVVKEHYGKDISKEAGEIWNLEHAKFEGIVESQITDAVDKAATEDSSVGDIKAFLASRGVSLKIFRNSSTEEMNVFVGSSKANKEEGEISKARKKKLKEEVKKAIQRLETTDKAFSTLGGSDSFVEIRRKKGLETVVKPFRKTKGLQISIESTKIKASKTKVEGIKQGKGTKSKRPSVARGRIGRQKIALPSQQRGIASEPLRLLGTLNKQLPSTVRENMDLPALRNRTGRFASSVIATDVIKTPQGFQSIGYTYQKDPYQTFEMGYAQGSPDRDPRTLIDRSIREIAAEFALGRLYTRRV